jgi:hypothetical protein
MEGLSAKMSETVVKVDHYSAAIANKAGEGARVLGALKDSGMNLIALWAYPWKSGKAQLEMIPENGAAFLKAAKKAGLAVGKKQTAFFVNGQDHPGAVAESLAKLAAAGINVGAVQAVCAGGGRYGAIIFLPKKDVRKAAKSLGLS